VRLWLTGVFVCGLIATAGALAAQAPRPFPGAAQQPARPGTPAPPPPTTKPAQSPAPREPVPTEATLGVPIYASSQFITSYDAGRGQRYYLFGTTSSYAEMVAYYRTALKQKGNELYESPPTYQFETGRFREETMAFPPSVTIKDYTWGGSAGYPNPLGGSKPERYLTVIQIVPAVPGQ
jgi:hypothetical protein